VELAWAGRSKRARAEPVAALYEQGRVVHCGAFGALEEELMALGASEGGPSPDRADALVWALTELMLGPAAVEPRIRRL
jgi:phage terminase large subunit-like protein